MFVDSTMSRTQVQLWYNQFKKHREGRKDVHNDARSGHPSMSTTDKDIEAMKKMILDNRRITIKEVAGISFGSCQIIFTDVLGIKRVAAKIAKF